MANGLQARSAPQLLRIPYHSTATGKEREFLMYVPVGYENDADRRWPVILFLHGGGAQGNGRDELDWVMYCSILTEAWLRHRDLPFLIISPQLPVFDNNWMVEGYREGQRKPVRGPQPMDYPLKPRPTVPIVRAPDTSPPLYGCSESWGIDGFPGGWQLCEDDLLKVLDITLRTFHTDPDRVYMTGISYGGHGTWYMSIQHPERFAAIAPICGMGDPSRAHILAERQMPIWMFNGGRDMLNKPQWAYHMANALEQAGHPSLRFTVHEDCGHDCWTRVYSGQDLYDWFLQQRRSLLAQ